MYLYMGYDGNTQRYISDNSGWLTTLISQKSAAEITRDFRRCLAGTVSKTNKRAKYVDNSVKAKST